MSAWATELKQGVEAQYWEDTDGRMYLIGCDHPFTGAVVEWYQTDEERLDSDYLYGIEHGLGLSWYEADVVEGSVTPLLGRIQGKSVHYGRDFISYRRDGGGEYLAQIIKGKPTPKNYTIVKRGNRKRVVYYREGKPLYDVWYRENGYRYRARGFAPDGKLGNVTMFYDKSGKKSFKMYYRPNEEGGSQIIRYDQNGEVLRTDRSAHKLEQYVLLSIVLLTMFLLGIISFAVLR